MDGHGLYCHDCAAHIADADFYAHANAGHAVTG